jgi:formylmethanofuran dehydrogenase subunit B
MTNEATSTVMTEVACPMCGHACDDLSVDTAGASLAVVAKGCERARSSFARLSAVGDSALPRIDGKPVSLDAACAEAARVLGAATLPVFGGMALDVGGARAAMELADQAGGVIDHMNNEFGWRASRVVQDGGGINTTLAEVRNRADLILLAGTDAVSAQPRFFERCVWVGETMFDLAPASRRIVYLGGGLDTAPGVSPDGRQPDVFEFDLLRMPEALSVLNALLAKQPVAGEAPLGIELARWQELADALLAAKYSVVVWAGPAFDAAQLDLNVGAVVSLVRKLNVTTRCNSLPLAGNDGDLSMGAVHTWQTGYPMRTSYASGAPKFDPVHNGLTRLLSTGEADALVWLNSLADHVAPPACGVPTVVIAPPSQKLDGEPHVFIPVATPGIHHSGHFVRTDKVVTLPLRALRATSLPAAETVAMSIAAKLREVKA